MPAIPALAWTDLVDQAESGDLLLFHGSGAVRSAIETVTDSPFSHVGMVYRASPGDTVLIWQDDPFTVVPDTVTGTSHGGAQVGNLAADLHVRVGIGDTPYFRKLVWDRPADFSERLVSLIEQHEGVPFGTMLEMAGHWLEGHFLHRAGPANEVYCAELVAMTYQQLGLLDSKLPPNFYSPASFGDGSNDVTLLAGSFAGQQMIDMSTVPASG